EHGRKLRKIRKLKETKTAQSEQSPGCCLELFFLGKWILMAVGLASTYSEHGPWVAWVCWGECGIVGKSGGVWWNGAGSGVWRLQVVAGKLGG
nr:hypothetical protein [Tanacetum cinerariifolium]